MNGAALNFTRRDFRHARQRIGAEKLQARILREMAREMPPTQAIVFMSYFHQFPEFAHGNDNYFKPAWARTCGQLQIRRRAFWKMTRALIDLGFLERRWCGLLRGWWEYRIVFEKLEKYRVDPRKGTT
jgi:hypothetical protein